MKTEQKFDRIDAHLKEVGRPAVHREPLRVSAVMAHAFVSVPSWFTADKAASVVRHTGKMFALVRGPRGETGLASLDDLATAPVGKSVGWCAKPLGPTVTEDATLDEAAALMDGQGLEHVAVVMGRLLVGVVARSVAMDLLLGATVPQHHRLAA